MSQEPGMFSVRRPREVRPPPPPHRAETASSRTPPLSRIILTLVADARQHQSQCLRHPHARLRHEALLVAKQLSPGARHSATCALNIGIAHVACAWTALTADLSPFFVWRQSGGDGLLDCTAPKHCEFSGEHGREEELRTCLEHTREPATAAREYCAEEQCLLCQTVCRLWTCRTPVFLRDRAAFEQYSHRPSETRPSFPCANGTGNCGILDPSQL